MPSSQDRLAIAEVVFWGGTALPCSLYLWVKQGWLRLEWLFVFILASLRVIGSILQLQQDDLGPPSTSIAIVNGIGLSPLFGITLMLVHRLCVTAQHQRMGKIAVFLHVVIFGTVPLLIVGILKIVKSGSSTTLGVILAAIGLAIFLQVYLAQTFLVLRAYRSKNVLKHNSLAIALFAMTPLLLLRLLYSALSILVTSSDPVGSMAAQVVLAVLPENLIALVAVGWGLLNMKEPKEQHNGYELS
ncbi:hypothetical protein BDV95DRAFT_612251 [Massariosphaeria phaeospora]|uniref:DUF7702 domain-containing protein n=1 Tax=Massariosphaeria phaeospora TaxID=100035 RepID=A0A7C8HZB2_9PLEO|nr:hypothetical protein BDV95DRAFT_612251 [Massariosphaeria phaeospora]